MKNIKCSPTHRSGQIPGDRFERTYAELNHWCCANGTSLYQRGVELMGHYRDRCKHQLFSRANERRPKPSYLSKDPHERRLSTALSRLTHSEMAGYDPIFDAEIRRVAPQWFVDTAATNKQVLLAHAQKGLPKPSKTSSDAEERRLSSVFSSYVTPSQKPYDSAFDAEIRKVAPEWFKDTAAISKRDLKVRAQNGLKRPSCQAQDMDERRLGQALVHYTTPSSSSYNAVFNAEIRKAAPKWFEDTLAIKKQILRSMAQNGQPRPAQRGSGSATEEHKLASALSRCTNPSRSTYDPIFDAEMREMAPHWFVDTAVTKKQTLLAIAKNGQDRPSSHAHVLAECQLGRALVTYTNKKNKTYDAIFDSAIRKIAPQWFEDTAAIKKQTLLWMAATKHEKPAKTESDEARQLINALRNYTRSDSGTYDAIFDARIRQIAPQWFEDSAAVKKQQLLQRATNGLSRPARGSVLGKALYSYMTQRIGGYDCYDPIFTAEIQKTAPAWFQPLPDTVAIKKRQLLARAHDNLPKPAIGRRVSFEEHQLGLALARFTNPANQAYDLTFTAAIRKAAPEWFQDTAADKKRRLLTRARDGLARPTEYRNEERQLGKALRRYTNPTNPGYDSHFDSKIRGAAPKWFERTATRSTSVHASI